MADTAARAACVVVTYDALPWIEQCLESVAEVDTVVVDNGSGDGTVDLVRERFPAVRLVESENRGLSAGWNTGIRATASEHVLLLNADAWLLDGALPALVAAADRHPRAAAIGPRLEDTDGTLQRSVRGYPSPWRIATEYFFLRKLAPHSHALNAFFGEQFDHESVREAEGRNNVRIINIAPGYIKTNIHAGMGITFDEYCQALGNPDFLSAEELADVLIYCWKLPQHICIRDLVVTPTRSVF